VLLLHSGGLCQRLPHVSAHGKAFMLVPDGRTLLELKLETYRFSREFWKQKMREIAKFYRNDETRKILSIIEKLI
jgi:hypothetical protein